MPRSIWSKLLRRNGQPLRLNRQAARSGPSCFEAWIRAYRQKLITGGAKNASIPRASIVALLLNHEDRQALTSIADQESLQVHFAESRVEAWDAMTRLDSPVILYDRDWPGAEWRSTVQTFASSPQRSCVILASCVADDYLWQELIRYGGYDLLAKPFQTGDLRRALTLALSYWKSARAAGA